MEKKKPDFSLDLRGEICPINFVKTKLKLEEMGRGEILEVLIDAGEPIVSVPRSIKEEGHKVINVQKVDEHFRLLIEKG